MIKNIIKNIIISLFVWHIIFFYVVQILLVHNIEHIDGCYCGSNLFTNTIYLGTSSTIVSYFTHLYPGRVFNPTIIDPYTYIKPMNIQFSSMVCIT